MTYSLQLFLLAAALPTTENGKKIFSRECCGLFSGNVNSISEYIPERSETLKLWKTKVMHLNHIK